MKIDIVFDNNVAKKLKLEFPSDRFNVIRVQSLGWETLKNGELIAAMATHNFKILIKDYYGLFCKRQMTGINIGL